MRTSRFFRSGTSAGSRPFRSTSSHFSLYIRIDNNTNKIINSPFSNRPQSTEFCRSEASPSASEKLACRISLRWISPLCPSYLDQLSRPAVSTRERLEHKTGSARTSTSRFKESSCFDFFEHSLHIYPGRSNFLKSTKRFRSIIWPSICFSVLEEETQEVDMDDDESHVPRDLRHFCKFIRL